MPTPRPLYADSHLNVSIDDTTGLVRYIRTAERYASLAEVRTAHAALTAAVLALPRTGLKLLIDVREAPARNDEEFEVEVTRMFRELAPKLTGHAILLKSAAGRLQTQRLSRERGVPSTPMFATEEEALHHLGVAR